MFREHTSTAGRVGSGAVLAVILSLGLAAAYAQAPAAPGGPSGRIDFAAANLPPANVEVDLGQEIFSDLFGLGDAAIAGVVESLAQAAPEHATEATKLAGETLAETREIVQIAKEVVREVRVRVYEDLEDEAGSADLGARFDGQLRDGHWDKVVRVHDGDDSVQVSFLRVEGSILGVFVTVADGNDAVLANVVCDVSPENVKKFTAAATKIGLENGLQQLIEEKVKHHH